MPNRRRFLSRRWMLGFLAAAGLLFGLAMLHPYPRQSFFGPTIRGKPRCVWEETVRRQFGEGPESLLDRTQRWLGVERPKMTLEEFDDAEMLPLVVELLDDPDAAVRAMCMHMIILFPRLRDPSALPVLRKWFHEDEFEIRCVAAHAIWLIDRDKDVLRWLVDQDDPEKRPGAMRVLVALAADTPELYPYFIAQAKDPDPRVRHQSMYAMISFGKKGVPALIDGLNDAHLAVRTAAVLAAQEMGSDARDAIPTLEARLKDTDADIAHMAPAAIRAIDPDRYRQLKAERKIE